MMLNTITKQLVFEIEVVVNKLRLTFNPQVHVAA